MQGRTHARIVAALAAIAAVGVIAGTAGAATVRTAGGLEFEVNEYVSDTVRWVPGHIIAKSNERVTWIDRDESPDPHTITVANKRALPGQGDNLFACQVCELANAHLEDPNNPDSDIARLRVNRGPAGMNQQGDSLVLIPGSRISARITAAVGRTIHYICAIHPWMQGSITVSRSGAGGGGAGLTGRQHH